MTSSIGRTPAIGGVGATREVPRDETRETERGGARRREGAGDDVAGAGDQVSLSPQALRGPAGGDADGQSTGSSDARETTDSAAVAFHDAGEALLAARGLAVALQADLEGAARAHDLISPLRAHALLRR
jgi:hypothetical protein